MKKQILIITVFASCIRLHAQNSKNDSVIFKRNNLGLDMTYFVKQFLNFSSTGGYYFENPYMLMYKREIKNSAIRSGIKIYHTESKGTKNDTVENSTKRYTYFVGLGYERKVNIYKYWRLFYGIDGGFEYSSENSKYQYTQTYYSTKKAESYQYSLLPFVSLGVEFNSRIILTTSSYLTFAYSQNQSSDIDTPANKYDEKTKGNGFNIQYIYPSNITLFVKF